MVFTADGGAESVGLPGALAALLTGWCRAWTTPEDTAPGAQAKSGFRFSKNPDGQAGA